MEPSARNYSSLSEFESLSDSDWLDIASSRASEDNDSLVGFEDSDREDVDGRPASRHSFTSYASERDEAVDAWEGLIDDASDLETPLPLAAEDALTSPFGVQARSSSPQVDDDAEDERVKAALDQSMISTLSSSRSNSLANSLQTSMVSSTRALRLSFPDPTTSRIESLNASYERLTRSDIKPHEPDATAEDHAESAADPGLQSTPEVPEDKEEDHKVYTFSSAKPDFSVVLYGSSPLAKHSLVQMLLDKWALSHGLALAQRIDESPRIISHVYDTEEPEPGKVISRRICVMDKTGLEQSSVAFEHNCPSLAVVFLPAISEISVFEHTLYLPVMTSSPMSLVDFLGSSDYELEAEQQWHEMGVASNRLTSLSQPSSPILDQELLTKASPAQIQHALRPLVTMPTTRKAIKPVSAYAISIMAILSIVLGYVVHGSVGAQTSLQTIVPGHGSNRALSSQLWSTLHTSSVVSNKSTATSAVPITTSASGSALSVSSLKDFAVAVFNPAPLTTTHSSIVAQPLASSSSHAHGPRKVASSAPSECECGCGLLTWPGKTDIMVRPTAAAAVSIYGDAPKSISVISTQSFPASTAKGKEKVTSVDTSLYALSTRIVTSLSEYFDFKASTKAAHRDMQDLMDAIDKLAQAIARQTASIWQQSKGTVALMRSGLRERNAHAKERAKQMREYGVQWISAVSEHIRVRADAAQQNARALREKVGSADMRKTSQGWGEELRARRLKRKMARQERRQARRMKRAMRAKARAEQ